MWAFMVELLANKGFEDKRSAQGSSVWSERTV
jgi:hypothetical protein